MCLPLNVTLLDQNLPDGLRREERAAPKLSTAPSPQMFAQPDERLNCEKISFLNWPCGFPKGQSAFGLFEEVSVGLRFEGLQPEIRNVILVGDRITASEYKGGICDSVLIESFADMHLYGVSTLREATSLQEEERLRS